MFTFKFKTKPPPAAKAAEIVAKLAAEDAVAKADLERCKSEYGAAAMAFEEDPAAGAAAVERARKAIEKARGAAEDAETKLAAARARHAEAVAAEAAQNTAAKWDAVEKHAADRLRAAQEAEKAIAALAAAWERMVAAGDAIAVERPVKTPGGGWQGFAEAALLGSGQVAVPLRLHMLKSGFRWAADWPWGPHGLPTLTERIADANAYLARVRSEGRVV